MIQDDDDLIGALDLGDPQLLELLDDGGAVDLIVSDVVMPKMGGLDLYTTLQERKSDTKMLLITGHPIQEENHALLEQGDIDWLQKPFSAYDFKQLLSKLLGI